MEPRHRLTLQSQGRSFFWNRPYGSSRSSHPPSTHSRRFPGVGRWLAVNARLLSGHQLLCSARPLPGGLTDGSGAATPTVFGAVTQQSRESGVGGGLCPVNNALILWRPGLDSVSASARAEGREGWASAHLEASTEASTFNPGGTGSHGLRHPPRRPSNPDSVSDPGLSPALPPFTASREHGPGADFSPVASPQPAGMGSSAAPCLSLLSVKWGRAVESVLQGEHRGRCVGRGSQCSGANCPLSVPSRLLSCHCRSPGALPPLVTDSQAEGRTAEVGEAWGLGWSAQGLRGRAPVLWGLCRAEKQRGLGAAQGGQGGEQGGGWHGAGRQRMGWPRGEREGAKDTFKKTRPQEEHVRGAGGDAARAPRGLKGGRRPPCSRPLARAML